MHIVAFTWRTRLTLSLVSVCMSAIKSRSSLMYCLMHSIAAVVHCWEQKTFYLLGRITVGSIFISCCFMRLILIRFKHTAPKILPPAALRSCAFGWWWILLAVYQYLHKRTDKYHSTKIKHCDMSPICTWLLQSEVHKRDSFYLNQQ